jgi:hypothetical protein
MNVEIGTESRPRYSFSGNICFKFSAFFLCSVISVLVKLIALLNFYLFLECTMQRLTIVLLFGLLALASASSKFKRLTPIQPQPQCSLLEVEMCAGEIGGKNVKILSDF